MTRFGAILRALTIVAVATGMSTAALAQQKTAKQCRDEWRANEADFKAKKIKEKDYVAQCQAGTATAPSPTTTAAPAATTGQKTAKQCRDEWKANEADFKAKNIKQKDYVTQCRGGTAAAPSAPTTTTTTTAPATPPAAPSAATSGQKTARQCRDEWKANEADFKAKQVTEKDYVAQCRAGTAAAPSAPTATTTRPTPPAPTATTAPPAAPPAPAPSASPPADSKFKPTVATAPSAVKPTGANQFADETQAKGHCPSDLVVWVNNDSNIYHFSGHKDYGKTKQGAYMCEKDALAAGDRASKSEKHP
jgi:hypothetical protein